MSKLALRQIGNIHGNPRSAQTALNENFQRISEAIDKLTSRDAEAPNARITSLDMNSFRTVSSPPPVEPPEPSADLVFIAGLDGDFYGVRTWAPTTGTILEDSGFLSLRFDSYAFIVSSSFQEFRARGGPYNQDAFESVTIDELGLTLETDAASFFQDSPNTVWQWDVDLWPESGFQDEQTYTLRFT